MKTGFLVRHGWAITMASSLMAAAPGYCGDWMIIGAEREAAPHRSLYVMQYGDAWIFRRLADDFDEKAAIASKNPALALQSKTIYIADVLQVFEDADGTNFIHYQVELNCQEGLVRILQATAYDRAGKQENSSAPDWMKVPDNWMGKAQMIACKWKNWEEANAASKHRDHKSSANRLAKLGMQYLGDYAAWTSVVDAIWKQHWPDATQPAYVKGTPEERERLKREGLATLDKARAIQAEQAEWAKISIAVSDKANRLGDKFAQEMASAGGLTEDQVIGRWGIPEGIVQSPGVRQLNYSFQDTRYSVVDVPVDIYGPVGKIGETSQPEVATTIHQCYRRLFLKEGGFEGAYRVFDFAIGCN